MRVEEKWQTAELDSRSNGELNTQRSPHRCGTLQLPSSLSAISALFDFSFVIRSCGVEIRCSFVIAWAPVTVAGRKRRMREMDRILCAQCGFMDAEGKQVYLQT